jgi:hypothetical protein
MKPSNAKRSSERYDFQFQSIRNITSPEDQENDRRVYTGQAPIQAVLGLDTEENVRGYLLEAEGRKRRVPTQVHKAIWDTLANRPHDFSVLNSGVVITAFGAEVDENKKTVHLKDASIINGAQTRGIIKDFLAANKDREVPPIHLKYEIIVTEDQELVADISIARNFQNDVMSLSIAGRLGQLDELQESLRKDDPNAKLRLSETQLADDYILTERLLQVMTALVPPELWLGESGSGGPNKVFTYSAKAKCLREFTKTHEAAKDPHAADHQRHRLLYRFYLDIAPKALKLYEHWKGNQAFKSSGLRAIKRDDAGNILEVPDGIIFPILASLANFAKHEGGKWTIEVPKLLREAELVEAAKNVYMNMAGSRPEVMGKSQACYSALYQITNIYKKLAIA